MVSWLLFDLSIRATFDNRQLDSKSRSVWLALAFDLPTQFVNGASHDEQPQTGTTGFVGNKGIEDAVLKFRWNSRSIILDCDGNVFCLALCGH